MDKLTADYNDALQVAKNQFPDYEFPLTVELDVQLRDPQRVYHRKLCSRLRTKFSTGRWRQPKKNLSDDPRNYNLRINPTSICTRKVRDTEFQQTIRRLLARKSFVYNNVGAYNLWIFLYNLHAIFISKPDQESLEKTAKFMKQY